MIVPVLRRELPVHIHAHRADDIATAVRICHEFGLRYVLVHATEGHLIADYLAKENISIICGPMINHRSKPELSGFVMDSPTQLAKAGIPISICTDHPETPIRYLPLTAALAVRGGLSSEEALRGITITAAEILGVSDRIGSVEPGKDADFTLYADEPVSMMTQPLLTAVRGKVAVNKII